MRKITICFLSVFLLLGIPAIAYENSRVREYEMEFPTYAYSNPDPVPVFGKIWPYFKYQEFATKPEPEQWKIVELENDFLIVRLLPQIGGKIWSVTDKITGRELFYRNDVLKFRDVALRGPWTSGGIEFNFGIIGHAPTCSSPVNYSTRIQEDGSVSCYLSELDLITRTFWNIEINLPKDMPWFRISTFWHNRTGASQPYYNWTNSAVETSPDLVFLYPGNHSIGHDGIPGPWPKDELRGKDLSKWSDNDFGRSKTYHILGSSKSWFGAYWTDIDSGVLKYSLRDDKLGGKIWIWALSGEGEIWRELLSDDGRQYVELQSGRLFNQNLRSSSYTPFKQILFEPYRSDAWTEYWLPFNGIGEVSDVSRIGAVSLQEIEDGTEIKIFPLQDTDDTLLFLDEKDSVITKVSVEFSAARPFCKVVPIPQGCGLSRISCGGEIIWEREDQGLLRPVVTVDGFHSEGAYGSYLLGRDRLGFGLYDEAEEFIRKSLETDPFFLPSLVEMARLQYRRMNYSSAFEYARKALAIDTYDSAANYEYGRSAVKLGNIKDAMDGFEVATLTGSYRFAAYTEISKIYFRKGDFAKAREYASKSLINNPLNIEGLQLSYLAASLTGMNSMAERNAEEILELEPMNHFIRFENYFNNPDQHNLDVFRSGIRNEFPEQTLLELGIWYHSLGLFDRGLSVLQSGPGNALTAYWEAFLQKDRLSPDELDSALEKASREDASFVFPFREETRQALSWAIEKRKNDWQPRYYLALLERSRGNKISARTLLETVKDDVSFPPFWVLKAGLCEDTEEQEACLKKAVELSNQGGEYVRLLARYYFMKSSFNLAEKVIAPYFRRHGDFPTGLLYVRILLENKKYKEAERILERINVLPSEGNSDSRHLYRRTKLSLALQALSKGDIRTADRKLAESQRWPRNLGIGKPYDDRIDNRIEMRLAEMVVAKESDKESIAALQQEIDAIGRMEHTALF